MDSKQPKTVFSTTGEILLLVKSRLNNQRFLIDLGSNLHLPAGIGRFYCVMTVFWLFINRTQVYKLVLLLALVYVVLLTVNDMEEVIKLEDDLLAINFRVMEDDSCIKKA